MQIAPARLLAPLALAASLALFVSPAQSAEERPWTEVLEAAQGQTVYWNAWGGDAQINRYIDWVGGSLEERHGVTLEHVRLADTADAVARVLAEKAAGRAEGGSVDLIWINGENFATMKSKGLLHGPFAEALPNFALVDTEGKPTTLVDFTVPTEGYESPWGQAQFNLLVDTEAVPEAPGSMTALAEWAAANPGRLSYPAPPDFLGTTFLKQALIELTPDANALQGPPGDDAAFRRATEPLWGYLEALHPHLWRGGRAFPVSGPALRQLLADGEVDMALSFHPGEADAQVRDGELPPGVRVRIFEGGTIGNTHFVAIPFNAQAKEGALVVANFLLSPEAQARKADPRHWGDSSVLDPARLGAEERALFEAIPESPTLADTQYLGKTLLEPHPAWMTAVEEAWLARYSR